MSKVVIYEITGMTCPSCERAIGSGLKEITQAIEVEVSLKLRQAAIRLPSGEDAPSLETLNNYFSQHGYKFYSKGQRPKACEINATRDPFVKRLKRALLSFGLVGLIALIAAPLRKLVPAAGTGASLGAMFALGLVASASSCLATTGGFLLSYSAKRRSRLTMLAVHVGRLFAFVIGGALLGAIGGSLPQGSALWYGLLGVVLGIAFLFVGLNLLELSPSLARFGIRMPSRLNKLADKVVASEKSLTPFLVGAVTFVLPCGFTQTAQGLALASGSAQRGLLLLTMFALGTLPVLLGVTWFGSVAATKYRMMRLATGAVLSFFALGQIDGGLTVLGSPITPSTFAASIAARFAPSVPAVPVANAQEQTVRMSVVYGTYQPRNLTIKKNVPVRWEIDAQDIGGCARDIVVPSYGISKRLARGLNVIQFTPKQTGIIPFSCGMGMIRGSFNVVE